MKNKNDIKVLFIHNSITWYRIPFFKELNNIINVTYVFTKVKNSEKYYSNIKTNYKDLDNLRKHIVKNYFNIAFDSFRLVAKNDYDIVLVTVLDSVDQCIEAIITCIIAKIRNKKIAYFWERWDPPVLTQPIKNKIKKRIVKIFFSFIIKNSDCFIVPGTKAKNYFLECGADEKKIFIANDASEIEIINRINIREKHGIGKEKKIILYFGRILERKGLDVLINAFAKIEKNFNNVFLLICGDGEYKSNCNILIEKLKISNFLFTGTVQPELRSDYYKQSNLFVLPSKFIHGGNEAWGLSLNEAMQCAKPVVSTTAVGSAYDLIKNGYNGYIVEQNNYEKLYCAMSKIISDTQVEKEMGKNSKKIIDEGYKYSDMANGFKKAFMSPFID